jgi:predicted dienelactone hydrolase
VGGAGKARLSEVPVHRLAGLALMLTGCAGAGAAGAQADISRQSLTLPPPTGPFAVGRATFRWVDSARHEVLSADPAARRELVVYVWYPSRATRREPAPYLPDFDALQTTVGDSALGRLAGAGGLRVHAREGAPLAGGREPHPLLLFSPGFGETALAYSTILEDLASHGYVVAAIEHPFDALGADLSGGRIVPFAAQAWEAASAAGPDSAIGYLKARVAVWAADSHFALDALTRTARLPGETQLLASHLDPARVGAFGHSLGGMATVRFCQLDSRIRACVNEDSDYRGVPLFDFGDGAPLLQPLMFIASDHSLILAKHTPPPNAKLQRQQAAQDSALNAVAGGSWRVGVETPGFTHKSFMRIVRTYTRAFFDRCLRGLRATALDSARPLAADVTVERFH